MIKCIATLQQFYERCRAAPQHFWNELKEQPCSSFTVALCNSMSCFVGCVRRTSFRNVGSSRHRASQLGTHVPHRTVFVPMRQQFSIPSRSASSNHGPYRSRGSRPEARRAPAGARVLGLSRGVATLPYLRKPCLLQFAAGEIWEAFLHSYTLCTWKTCMDRWSWCMQLVLHVSSWCVRGRPSFQDVVSSRHRAG